MDIVGGFYLRDGTELKCLTGIDDHSRFCVSARLMARATARPVCEALKLRFAPTGCRARSSPTTARCSPPVSVPGRDR